MIALMIRDILPMKWLFLGALLAAVILLPAATLVIESDAYPLPMGPVVVMFGFGFFLCGMTFQSDDKYKSDVIVCSMPYSRLSIVGARYLLSVLVFVAMAGIGYGVQMLLSVLTTFSVPDQTVAGYVTGGMLGLVLVFFVYPAYFRLGLAGGQPILFIVFFSVSFLVSRAVRVVIVNYQAGHTNAAIRYLVALSAAQVYMVAAGFVVLLGLLSFVASVYLYRAREL